MRLLYHMKCLHDSSGAAIFKAPVKAQAVKMTAIRLSILRHLVLPHIYYLKYSS